MKKTLLFLFSAALMQISNAQTKQFTDGIFILNEDWFGHANGSLNFIDTDQNVTYNAYKTVNPGEELGVTSQFGTIYGDNMYLVSKQGNRFVVADAKTLVKKASFETIGADGRSFVGVNSKKGYIGSAKGIYHFDIENLKIGSLIEGSNTAGQIGNMVRTSKYVFAVTQSGGILVIDPVSNSIKQKIEGTYFTLVISNDGNIWAHATEKIKEGTKTITQHQLVKINPITFETEKILIPTKTISTSWGAWNAGSLTSSTSSNLIYFVSGINIVKFDATAKTFDESFIEIPGQDTTPKQTTYGAALRVDPLTNDLVLTTIGAGWGTNSQLNYVHTFSNDGKLKETVKLSEYYWFPSVPFFPDVAEPKLNNIENEYAINGPTTIDLKDKVTDVDNIDLSIVKDLELVDNNQVAEFSINDKDELEVTPLKNGSTKINIVFTSNGKSVSKTVLFNVANLSISDVKKSDFTIYPNPAKDIVYIDSNENCEIEIFSIAGNKIKNITLIKGKNKVDVSSLYTGVYIIKHNNSTFKLIKK